MMHTLAGTQKYHIKLGRAQDHAATILDIIRHK